VNGKKYNVARGAKYFKIDRQWNSGDKVELILPMAVRVKVWEENKNAVSIMRGPLTYSLKIKEEYVEKDSKASAIGDSKWQEDADPSKWPSYEIVPGSDWNYGVVKSELERPENLKVIKKDWPKDSFPFEANAVPISITIKAKQLKEWLIDRHGLTGVLPLSPLVVDTKEQVVELIPMGAARLRISAFPVVN
jgi:hypothetical protein